MFTYPEHIVQPLNDKINVFKFSPAVAYIFSLCSGISEEMIMATKIYPRTFLRFIPLYRAVHGGGAITLGSKNWQSITLTENFFSNDSDKYGRAAYANAHQSWMRLCAHEIGHIKHTQKYGWLFWYLLVFAYEYMRYGHDGSSLEAEAEQVSKEYTRFNSFVNSCISPEALQKLLEVNIDEKFKKEKILAWWQQFKNA
ncbi:MAG: hypothetical protein HKN67_13570 [Saprospiraceae bacterium]|nr:hypothetical protein [Bacteroidia bacterium]NNF22962.1 hypothetical protein [Saprospiraceae bacterium]NNK89685.1 hypothetical protein [Saprospiraceae bacterium]